MIVTEFLSKLPIFSELDLEAVASIAQSVNQLSFHKDQTVVFRGASVNGLHIIATGKVGVHAKPKNHSSVQVAELGPGEIFGETSIVENSMATATIKCLEDNTTIYIVPENTFADLFKRDPKVHDKTCAMIAERKSKSASLLNQPQ